MREAYLRNDVFYSFCYKLSFKQHPINVWGLKVFSVEVTNVGFEGF